MVEALVFLVVGLLVGGGAGWFVGRVSAPAGDGAALAAAQATVEGLKRQVESAEKRADDLLEAQRRDQQVREAASAEQSQVLKVMAPIAQKMQDMALKVDEIEKARHLQHGELKAQILETHRAAGESRAAAQKLESVMRDNQKRGKWGEVQLRRVVESAGMLNRVDFHEQTSKDMESGLKRPDLVVQLPGRKFLAVDAKVPFAAYQRAHDLELEDEEFAAAMKAHATELRQHVREMAKRNYFHGLPDSPEFTVIFFPSEGIVQAACDADPDLMDFALDNKVVIATPNSLMAVLKSVAHVWKQEVLVDQAREVAKLGEELFDRLKVVARHATTMGTQIGKTADAYNEFARSLERNLFTTVRRLDQFDGLPELPEVDGHVETFSKPELTAALEDVERPEIAMIEPSAQGLGQVSDEVG